MTQEDKQLLLVDLCARLPYHVRCKIWLKDGTTEEGLLDLKHNYGDVLQDAFYYNKIKDIKPYLRPLSSMTEEELKEYHKTFFYHERYDNERKTGQNCSITFETYDWLNAHHFDYLKSYDLDRKEWLSMIEKGLALEAPEGMYELK